MEKVLFLDSPMKEKPYGSMRIQEKFGFGPMDKKIGEYWAISCLLYTSPSPRDLSTSRMPSSA